MKILHQAGHNTNWNIQNLQKNIGDGIIFSPVHYNKERLDKEDNEICKKSFFDPQYFIPESEKKKLNSYDFFPQRIMEDKFNTKGFINEAKVSAKNCIEFQIEKDFEGIIIPARYHDEMITDFIERQKQFTIEPFLQELSHFRLQKDIFISLPLTSSMIKDINYQEELLNWITSYQEINGIYLLINQKEDTKQIVSLEKLERTYEFLKILINNKFKVIFGYSNVESLLFSSLDLFGVTMGAYENTRMFSVDKFFYDEDERRGPAPRLYLPKLLNWIRLDTLIELKRKAPELFKEIYDSTEYSEIFINEQEKPHFSKPGLYFHHFELMYKQHGLLQELNLEKRLEELKNMVYNANKYYYELEKARILMDYADKPEHLSKWNIILDRMSKEILT